MIESYSFGQIVIDGKTYTQDVIIRAGEVIPSWWRKEGHRCDWEDIAPYISAGIKCVILGSGASGLMRPTEKLREKLEEKGIELIVHPTKEAVQIYNARIKEADQILAGFHLTC